MAQISGSHHVLYVTGEESTRQIKLRANRLRVAQENISLVAETEIDEICGLIEQMRPDLVVNRLYPDDALLGRFFVGRQCIPGEGMFRQIAGRSQSCEIPTFIVGHVNKDGAIAGPKVMEHIVDTVLYFEGDKTLPYRILRGVKKPLWFHQ